MAEAIGLIASVIQVAGAGLKLSQTLYQYADGVATADRRIKDIAKEIELTSFVIEELGNVFKHDETSSLMSKNAVKTANETMKECSSVFTEIDATLKKSKKNTLGRLMLPFRDNKIELLRNHIDKLKSTLQLLMQVLTHAHQVATKKLDREAEAKQKAQIQELIELKKKSTKKYEESLRNISLSDGSTIIDPDEATSDKEKDEDEPVRDLTMVAAAIGSTITPKTLATCVQHIRSLLEDIETLQQALTTKVEGDDHSEHHQSLIGSYFRARGHLDSVLFSGSKASDVGQNHGDPSTANAKSTNAQIGIQRVKTGSTLIEGLSTQVTLTEGHSVDLAQGEAWNSQREKDLPASVPKSKAKVPAPPSFKHKTAELAHSSVSDSDSGANLEIEIPDTKPEPGDWYPIRKAARQEAFNKYQESRDERDTRKPALKFQDASGKLYSLPYNTCKTWEGMKKRIERIHDGEIFWRREVTAGKYDILDSDGHTILDDDWEDMIEPGMSITMRFWNKDHQGYNKTMPGEFGERNRQSFELPSAHRGRDGYNGRDDYTDVGRAMPQKEDEEQDRFEPSRDSSQTEMKARDFLLEREQVLGEARERAREEAKAKKRQEQEEKGQGEHTQGAPEHHLRSHRDLLTSTLHEGERAAALQNLAARKSAQHLRPSARHLGTPIVRVENYSRDDSPSRSDTSRCTDERSNGKSTIANPFSPYHQRDSTSDEADARVQVVPLIDGRHVDDFWVQISPPGVAPSDRFPTFNSDVLMYGYRPENGYSDCDFVSHTATNSSMVQGPPSGYKDRDSPQTEMDVTDQERRIASISEKEDQAAKAAVATAALGAAGVGLPVEKNTERRENRQVMEAAIGGIAASRIANGPRSRSRSRARGDISDPTPKPLEEGKKADHDEYQARVDAYDESSSIDSGAFQAAIGFGMDMNFQGDASPPLAPEIDTTAAIMHEDINKISERGERLDNLQEKSDDLATSAAAFRRAANQRQPAWTWSNPLSWLPAPSSSPAPLEEIVEPSKLFRQAMASHQSRDVSVRTGVAERPMMEQTPEMLLHNNAKSELLNREGDRNGPVDTTPIRASNDDLSGLKPGPLRETSSGTFGKVGSEPCQSSDSSEEDWIDDEDEDHKDTEDMKHEEKKRRQAT